MSPEFSAFLIHGDRDQAAAAYISQVCEVSSYDNSEMMNNSINRFLSTVIKESVAAKIIYLDIIVGIL